MAHAVRALEMVDEDRLAALSFMDMIEQGASPVTFISASADASDDLPPLVLDLPSVPWCVVVRPGGDAGLYIIEGYGDDLGTPRLREDVRIEGVLLR